MGVAILAFIAGLQHLYWELRPFYLPAEMTVIAFSLSNGYNGIWDWITYVVSIGIWFQKFGDDDRWGRRRRKVAGVVRRLASGRLVVAPH